jgi:hypothetical protein
MLSAESPTASPSFRLLVATLCVSITLGGQPGRNHLRDRQLADSDPNDPPVPTQFFDNESGGGFQMPQLPIFEDEDGDGMPDWLDFDMSDWSDIDWNNFPLENFDWGSANWNPEEWNSFLQSLLGGTGGNGLPPMEFCPILETAVGIGQGFGIAGDCSCEGGLGDGLSIECSFEECLEASVVCGSLGMNVTVDDSTGLVKTTACMDTALDQYEEICFSYQLDTPETSGTVFDLDVSCEASYGGNPCSCSMEDRCLSIDCSAYLPGAKMDTCQYLAFDQPNDAVSLMPRFEIFSDTFDGMFEFENIAWSNLDWGNLDWNNFDFAQVDWTNTDWTSTTWGSLFQNDMTQVEICPILTGRVLGLSEDMMGQGCSCEGELESGFNLLCSFEQQCISPPTGDTAISQNNLSETICGDLALDLAFDTVGSITGSLCVDFADDIHPTTCIDYSIPIANQESLPKCDAMYGDDRCECTIDEKLCVSIDCSMYEPTAVMDTCQILAIENQEDVVQLVPRFGIPSTSSVEEEGKDEGLNNGENTEDEIPGDSILSEANKLENANSGAASASSLAFAGLAGLFSALVL